MTDNGDHENFNMLPLTHEQFEEFKRSHMEQHMEQQKRHETEVQAFQMEKDNFLANLNAEQLVTLRKILRAASEQDACAYLLGEIAAILKYVHKVDPKTGLDPYEQLFNSHKERDH